MIVSTRSPKFDEIKSYFKDFVAENDYLPSDDLHHHAFNMDYYIIGTHKAKEWCGADTWEIIDTIVNYENFNFGRVTTELGDPERVVNMYTYIVGEQIVQAYLEENEDLAWLADQKEAMENV
jgi:hypothetical protein